jgi:eukaryotic-like serine/threonine-protein kinase
MQAQRPEAPPAAVGEVIDGKYRVDRLLGKGGMGYVVAAWHLKLDEPVALKFLRGDLLGFPGVATRFEREAKSAAKIKGEHVCRVLDVGHSPSHGPFMVMEYLQGEDLGSRLEGCGKLPIAPAVNFVLQACEALAEAHSRGIVHRDLKPSNLFLTKSPSGQPLVKLLDFGISKTSQGEEPAQRLTATDTVMGSFAYMSPEHVRNAHDVDARTDVWALGVILFELVTASLPFPALSQSELIAKISADPPVPLRSLCPDAPAELEAIILRCLTKEADRRYGTVAELARALEPFAPGSEGLVESILRISSATLRMQAVTAGATVATGGGATPTAAPDSEGPTDVVPPRPAPGIVGATPAGTLPSAGVKRPSPLGDLSVAAGSTAASWSPSRLATLGSGGRGRWVGAIAVGAALAALGTAFVVMTRPPHEAGGELAPGAGSEAPASGSGAAGDGQPTAATGGPSSDSSPEPGVDAAAPGPGASAAASGSAAGSASTATPLRTPHGAGTRPKSDRDLYRHR